MGHGDSVVMRSAFLVAWVIAAAVTAVQAQTIIIPRAARARPAAPRRHLPHPVVNRPAQRPTRFLTVTNQAPLAPRPPVLVVPVTVVVDPEKTKIEQEAVLKHTVEFQRVRAESGSAQAQYDLGKRYFSGDGVEKDLREARKWLALSAQQGNELAGAKLEQLNKLEPAEAQPPP